MSLFKKLFGPSKREQLESYVAAEFERFRQLVSELTLLHDNAYAGMGLPVPTLLKPATYRLDFSGNEPVPKGWLTMPQFHIPPYYSIDYKDKLIIITENIEEAQAKEAYKPTGGFWLKPIAELPHVTIDDGMAYYFYERCNRGLHYPLDVKTDGKAWYDRYFTGLPKPPIKMPNVSIPEAAANDFRKQLFEALHLSTSDSSVQSLTMKSPCIDPPVNKTPFSNLKILVAGQIKPAQMAGFLSNLRTLDCSIAFELIAGGGSVYYRLGVPTESVPFVKQQLSYSFPEFAALEQPDALELPELTVWRVKQGHFFYEHIRCLRDFSMDPYYQFVPLLESASREGFLCLQLVLRPIPDADAKLLIRIMNNLYSKRDKDDPSRDFHTHLSKKMPLWVAGVNCIGADGAEAERLLNTLTKQYSTTELTIRGERAGTTNSFTRDAEEFMVFSTDELTALAHFPISPLPLPSLETTSAKAKLPPELFTKGEVSIGESEVHGKRVPVTLPNSIRDRHLYIVGKTRMGKSTLITNIALADIDRGAGVCVIDPHGDLVEDLLNTIPAHRVADTIYFNANDKEHPIALNVFQARNDDEVVLLADNLHVTFRRLSESWGQRMDDILRATLQTLAATPGSNFVDIKRLLQDAAFRVSVTAKLDHPMLGDFWRLDYPAYPKDAATPIISRVNRFLFAPHFYRMFSTTQNALSIADVVAKQKILLVNLASGAIGEDNATVLGSLLVSQIQQAVMQRAGLPKEARTPYYLFVDEFQNFTNSAFDKILSEAGKYQLCLTLAHQFISQLQDNQRDAIFGNVGTMIMFGVGDKDASYLRNQIGNYEPSDLLNMPPYQALCRPATSVSDTFQLKTLPPPHGRQSYAKEIIANTHARYSITAAQSKTEITEPEVAATISVQAPMPAPVVVEPKAPDILAGELRPVAALPKEFGSAAEKILHYISAAEYLSTAQIIELCFSHQSEGARKANASRELSKLVEAKKLRSEVFGSGKIYSLKSCNPTSHNLTIRTMYVRIVKSNFEIAETKFNLSLGDLNPDLMVSFVAENGRQIKTFWEYDTGTEGVAELIKKVQRYESHSPTWPVTFVFDTRARQELVSKSIKAPFIRYTILNEFTSLQDPCFYSSETKNGSADAPPVKNSFFRYS